MKKILVVLMVLALAVPYFFAEDVEAVAGEGNYKIDMKLHNFVREAYANKIASEICLPFSQYFKMYLDMSFEDTTDLGTGKFNNTLKLFVGSSVTETVDIGIMLGGGTAIPVYTHGDNATSIIKSGEGQLLIGLGLKLKSAMFGSKLNDIYIRQFVTIHLAGTGAAEGTSTAGGDLMRVGGPLVGNTIIFGDSAGTNDLNKYEYFGVDYSGTIGTGIPFDIGLPKFALCFEVGYGINYVGYSAASKDLYDTMPSKIAGNVGLNIKLQINYTPAVENEIWVKPEFTSKRYSYKLKAVTGGADQDLYNLDYPAFNLYVGANWKVTFAKIVWLKLDCEWKLSAAVGNVVTSAGRNVLPNSSISSVATLFNKVDPGIKLGFNFEGWGLELGWKPRFAFGQDMTSIASLNSDGVRNGYISQTSVDSNVWNLSNWDFGVSCSFPPPTK